MIILLSVKNLLSSFFTITKISRIFADLLVVNFKERRFEIFLRRKFFKIALFNHFAVDDYPHAVAKFFHKRKNMRGNDNRLSLVFQVYEEIRDRFRGDDVQPVGRLVENDKIGVVNDRDDERNLLFHTRGKVADFNLGEFVYTELFEKGVFAFFRHGFFHSVKFGKIAVKIFRRKKIFQFQFAR